MSVVNRIIIFSLLILSIYLLLFTKIGCSITSFAIEKLIQSIHLILCIAIIIGPFIINDKSLLIVYIICVSFIIFHWFLSSDVCALTLLEQWVTGKNSESTFIGRIVKPIYNVTNNHVTCITIILLLISIIRLSRLK